MNEEIEIGDKHYIGFVNVEMGYAHRIDDLEQRKASLKFDRGL